MCGIAGIVGSVDRPVDDALVRSMTDALWHRGPDDEGFLIQRSVGLGMRRLAIIDVESGRQPIHNEEKSVWVVFNGEIYNHAEIRRELEGIGGHRFRTDHSDTEVIVHAFEEWGIDCVHRFRGMFALGIWDARKRELWLVRDRIGIEQLDVHGRLFLHPREHLEPAPSALALRGVGRVGKELELGEDEAWHDERAADESALHDVGDAAVDDDGSVEERALRPRDTVAATMSHLTRERTELHALDRAGGHADRAEHDRAD